MAVFSWQFSVGSFQLAVFSWQFSVGSSQLSVGRAWIKEKINWLAYLKMGTFKDLLAYQKSFELAMAIYRLSKGFPKEETYSLTDQIRRSSRSTNICIVEAYRKRKYPNHFISKLTDADMENSETQGWLQFCRACEYISEENLHLLNFKSEEVGKLINYMMSCPEKFGR